MKCLRVCAVTLNQTPLDWTGNLDNIIEAVLDGINQQSAVICLPELCITGYGCEDHFHSTDVQKRALKALTKIAQVVPADHVVCVGLPVAYNNALYNMIAVITDRKVVGMVAKQHLAGDGLHYEPRWFKPWPAGVQGTLQFGNDFPYEVPVGDLLFDFNGIRIGFEICEDAWVAERPGAHLARKGVDIILNPSASHFAFGKHEVRKRFVVEGSRAFSSTYIYANLLGNEAGRAIYDGGCLIASGGSLVARNHQRFSMDNWLTLTAIVDVEATKTKQISSASFTPEYDTKGLVKICESLLIQQSVPNRTIYDYYEPQDNYKEFTQAVTLGLYDYMRKSHSKGFVISLSGGADSAVCALLVHEMIKRGVMEMGLEPFLKKAGLPGWDASSLARKLLTCLYQSTEHSSETTLNAARAVAEDGIGAKFHSIDVDAIVKAYTSLVAVAVQHEFSWDKDDVTLQNIQARARAPGVWMIANLENKLLLTTSNRSEAAVGYCTMDGDTAGCLAPIGGIDKHFLLGWLRYYAKESGMKELDLILKQQPTAELRPGSQTDESDLMPYQVLEHIEDLAILEKKGPKEVFECLKASAFVENTKVSDLKVYSWVEKFFKLWCRNQWKRERYALSFHVDNKNLDPRSWCRFPVLSGGFEDELAEIRCQTEEVWSNRTRLGMLVKGRKYRYEPTKVVVMFTGRITPKTGWVEVHVFGEDPLTTAYSVDPDNLRDI